MHFGILFWDYISLIFYLNLGINFINFRGIRKGILYPISWIWKPIIRFIKINFIERKRSNSSKYGEVDDDPDVVEEIKLVKSGEKNFLNSPVVINSLRKTFGKKVSVKDLTFSLDNNECFGFLGILFFKY
jgi:hypothetical protein